MIITADSNIPFVEKIFSHIGKVNLLDGRKICQKDLKKTDILLVRSVTKVNALLLANTNIKFVATATAGIDHIDTDYLQKNDIGFTSAPGSNAKSACEYVISAICYWSLYKEINLKDIKVGIIGYGNVGKAVDDYCKKLGLKTYKNDPPLQDMGEKELVSLNEVLQSSNVVTCHTPLTYKGKHKSHNLINKNNLHYFHKNKLLINAARGGVVCEKDLLKFQKKQDFSYIFDVWENEPAINKNVVHQALLATAHIAGYSIDGKIRGTKMIYNSCCDFFNIKRQQQKVTFMKNKNIDVADIVDVRKVIMKAYDIKKDNDNLKKILQDKVNDKNYFDFLRKNYPPRREFKFLSLKNISKIIKKKIDKIF
jgi:erythronate-4-phosphate dehydrogenase